MLDFARFAVKLKPDVRCDFKLDLICGFEPDSICDFRLDLFCGFKRSGFLSYTARCRVLQE